MTRARKYLLRRVLRAIPLFTDIFTHFFIFHDLISTTSTSLTFPFPGYSTLVFFYLEFYNKEVASSGRSAVSPVSEVSGLTLKDPENTLRLEDIYCTIPFPGTSMSPPGNDIFLHFLFQPV